MRRAFEFLFLAAIVLVALGIAAVHAPDTLRARFPIPLLYAAFAGLALAVVAGVCGLDRSPALPLAVSGMLLVGLMGVTLGRWKVVSQEWRGRRHAALTKEAAEQATRAALARRMVEAYQPDEADAPETRKHFEEFVRVAREADEELRLRWTDEAIERRLSEETGLWRWLNNRTWRRGADSQPWPAPWPVLLTAGELLLSALAGGWAFSQFARPPATKDPPA